MPDPKKKMMKKTVSPMTPQSGRDIPLPATDWNKHSVKDDINNPGARMYGLRPLKQKHSVTLDDGGNSGVSHIAEINKDGKSGVSYHQSYTDVGRIVRSPEVKLSYNRVREIKNKYKLR